MIAPLTFREETPEAPQVGDCWRAPWLLGMERGGVRLPPHFLSDRFIAAWHRGTRRAPLVVRVPVPGGGSRNHCIDGPDWAGGRRDGRGWQVHLGGKLTPGERPPLTVDPAIPFGGGWYGRIVDGVLYRA